MISSNEIVTLINALGLDPKAQEIDLKDLRYGKIIIMTDADVDGSHIRALLLTFFNNKPFNKLIENGHVYLAQPPLFKICLLYTSPSPRDGLLSRMPSSA